MQFILASLAQLVNLQRSGTAFSSNVHQARRAGPSRPSPPPRAPPQLCIRNASPCLLHLLFRATLSCRLYHTAIQGFHSGCPCCLVACLATGPCTMHTHQMHASAGRTQQRGLLIFHVGHVDRAWQQRWQGTQVGRGVVRSSGGQHRQAGSCKKCSCSAPLCSAVHLHAVRRLLSRGSWSSQSRGSSRRGRRRSLCQRRHRGLLLLHRRRCRRLLLRRRGRCRGGGGRRCRRGGGGAVQECLVGGGGRGGDGSCRRGLLLLHYRGLQRQRVEGKGGYGGASRHAARAVKSMV